MNNLTNIIIIIIISYFLVLIMASMIFVFVVPLEIFVHNKLLNAIIKVFISFILIISWIFIMKRIVDMFLNSKLR